MEEKKEKYSFSILLKPVHMFHFLMRHAYTSFSGVIGLLISFGALVLFILTCTDNEPFRNGILLILAALFTIINPIQLWFRANQQVKLNPMFQKPLNYTFYDEQLVVTQEEETLEIPWEGVYRAVETGKSIILYMSRVHAYIFPKEQLNGNYEGMKQFIIEHVPDTANKLKNK